MTRTSFRLNFGTFLRPVKNIPPPSIVKTHDHRPRLDQEFDKRYPYLRSVNFDAQNTVLTAAIRNKTKTIIERNAKEREKNILEGKGTHLEFGDVRHGRWRGCILL